MLRGTPFVRAGAGLVRKKNPKTFVFVHHTLPGQFPHIARALVADGHNVAFITREKRNSLHGVTKVVYERDAKPVEGQHRFLKTLEDGMNSGQMVANTLIGLKRDHGIDPDVIIGHSGWGEMLWAKDVSPRAKVVSYFEFYYRAKGADLGFDPEYPGGGDALYRLRPLNAINLMSLEGCDRGLTPTHWQQLGYPAPYRSKISVIHEGVDSEALRRKAEARLELPDGTVLTPGHEVVTYVSRNLEPYRGFPTFMRAIPSILARRPNAHIVLVGGNGVSYGSTPVGSTYKELMLKEVAIDPARVHFLGNVPYQTFLNVLHISSAHIYLTYPFVLSWSMLESMAAECLVIGSRTSPVEEVIEDGRNGLLVDFKDHQGVADRVVDALANQAAYWPLRRAARQTVLERYDLHRICLPQMRAFLNDTLNGRSWA